MIARHDIQLVFLPPIGSDERAFYPQQTLPYKVITPAHILWKDGESLREHAQRFYAHLVRESVVDPTQPIVWAGLSLGGAFAQEFATIHPPLGLVLLATFRSHHELSPVVRAVGHVAHTIPLLAYRLAGEIAPLMMKALGYMSKSDIDMMVTGYKRMSKRSFRTAFKALSHWPGAAGDAAPDRVPTLRIHGLHDPLIPFKRVSNVDLPLDTMHLVTLAQPEEVNWSVNRFIDRLLVGLPET